MANKNILKLQILFLKNIFINTNKDIFEITNKNIFTTENEKSFAARAKIMK